MQHEVDRNQQWARRWWRSCDSRAKVHLSLKYDSAFCTCSFTRGVLNSWPLLCLLCPRAYRIFWPYVAGSTSGTPLRALQRPWGVTLVDSSPLGCKIPYITQAPKYCNIEILRRLSRLPVLCNSWCSQPCLARPCLSGLAFSSIVDGFTIVNFRRFKSKL